MVDLEKTLIKEYRDIFKKSGYKEIIDTLSDQDLLLLIDDLHETFKRSSEEDFREFIKDNWMKSGRIKLCLV